MSTQNSGYQSFESVTSLPNGGFVAFWSSYLADGSGYGIKAQIFDSAGAKVGGDFVVNQNTAGDQAGATATVLANGEFVVAWISPFSTSNTIQGRLFDSSGNAVGNEFTMVAPTSAVQDQPKVFALGSGGFALTWWDQEQPYAADDLIRVQMFDASGAKVGGIFSANAVPGVDNYPSGVSLSNGNFILTWVDQNGPSPAPISVHAQLFDPAGAKIGGEFRVSSDLTQQGSPGEAAALPGGGFVVAWAAYANGDWTARAQVFDAAGSRVGAEIVTDAHTIAPLSVQLTTLSWGGFVIGWEETAHSTPVLKGEMFDVDGTLMSGPFQINTIASDYNSGMELTTLSGDRIAAIWTNENNTGPLDVGVKGQLLLTPLAGTTGADTLAGGPGDDIIAGRAGNDQLSGLGGADVLAGGAGDDTLIGGGGGDQLDGGDGNDLLKLSGTGDSTAAGGAGTDRLVIDWADATNAIAHDPFTGTAAGGYAGLIEDGVARSVSFTGIESFDITTGSGNDVVRTGGNGDTLHLGDGDDVLTGGAGADTLDGGAGTDTVDYSAEAGGGGVFVNLRTTEIYGASTAFGPQRGLDTYGSYDSLLNIENVKTGGGNDSVYGDDGANRIETGAGADYLNGGGGNDQLDGGAGNDVLSPSGLGHVSAAGGADYDLLYLDWSAATGAVVLNAPSGTALGGYSGSIADDGARSVDFTGIEAFYLTTGSGNDVVRMGGNEDTVNLGAGDDFASGGGGNDHLLGDAGDDVLSLSGLGHAVAMGGADYDRLVIDWSDATSAITSGTLSGTGLGGYSGSIGDGGARTVDFGQIESFDITTGSANDVVRAGGNDDVIHLGAGDDLVYLGTGDPNTVGLSSGGFIADGGAGTDGITVDLTGVVAPVVWNLSTNSYSGPVGSFVNFEYFVSLTSGSGNDRITTSTQALDDLILGGNGADIITVYAGHDAVSGGNDNDMLVVDYSAATDAVTTSGIQPGSGGGAGWRGVISDGASHGVAFDDIERLDVTTGSGNDSVFGTGGADTIRTGLGTDTLAGGGGNDILDGGAGADNLFGGTGNDVFYVDDAGDVVTENAGEGTADEVRTALNNYVLPANVEILTWTGTGAGDVRGNASDNILTGGAAGDFFRLQDGGNDTVNGGGGNDAFYFGTQLTAADMVDGGTGSDQLAIQGDYSGGLTLGAGNLVNVETLVVMTHSDIRFGGGGASPYSYNIATVDANVAAGTQLLVNASTLEAGENLTFNGSAETNGSFFIYGGKGIDTLTGGAGADVFFFAEDGRFAATDHIDGGAGDDVMVLRGNYSLTLSGTSIVNVETVVLNSGSDARFYSAGTPFSYDVTTADDTVAAGQTMTFNGGQLAANETLHFDGAAETNGNFRLFGGAADDIIKGGAGNDLIYGGLGADQLTGGAGADTFRYASAAQSSSTHFDTIFGFTVGTDHIDLPFAVSGFADHQATGRVDFATFDADVARLVDGDLNPFGAIELSANGGDIGTRFFLVVDADGDGAYHANLDYVIELPNVVVPPTPDIFV